MQLLLGCGYCKEKRIGLNSDAWEDLVTLDLNPDCKPDIIWNMNNIPLPFSDNSADEIHIYDVLEHLGTQGDWKFFFNEFEDFWRILKPNGFLFATVPAYNTIWAFGDPGHTRIFNEGTVSFLDQEAYMQCGNSKRTDYRNVYKGNLKSMLCNYDDNTGIFTFILKAIK